MVKGYKNLQMEISIEVPMRKASLVDLGNTIGPIKVISKENSKMVYERDKGFGKSLQAKAINMKEAIRPIKKMAMGSSHGQVETSIKGTTMKT